MLKNILTQILNRKRSNSWIIAELFLVFILVWYISDYFFVLGYNRHLPDHHDVKHVWVLNFAEYDENHPKYRASENDDEARKTNHDRIFQTLKNHPGVENVTVFAGYGSSSSYGFQSGYDSTVNITAEKITIDPHSDYFRTFNYTTGGGKKPVSIQDFNWAENKIVISQMLADKLFPDGEAIGKSAVNKDFTVIGVVDDIKRYEYERPQCTFYMAADEQEMSRGWNNHVAIRIRPSAAGALFEETFKKETAEKLQTGNFYLKDIFPYSTLLDSYKEYSGISSAIRERGIMMLFFLLNILLCVIGTFWYRIHSRREETGIRKAMGSTSDKIRNMLLIEGFCLLGIAMLPAIIVEFQFVHANLIDTWGVTDTTKGMYLPDHTLLRFLITNGITFIIMAAVVAAAIWLPARKAAALQPADALHYE